MKGIWISLITVVLINFGSSMAVAQQQSFQSVFNSPLGPNAIDPVLFKFSGEPGAVSDKGKIYLTFWPQDCSSCAMAAAITESTEITDTEGSPVRLSSLSMGKVFKAQSVVFNSDSNSVLASIVVVTDE